MPCPNKPTKSWIQRPHVATMSFPAVVASQYLLYQFHNLSNHLKYSFFVLKIKAHLHFRTYDETMSRSCLCRVWSLAASANSSWKMFLWLKRGAATRAALWHFHENTAQTIEKKTTVPTRRSNFGAKIIQNLSIRFSIVLLSYSAFNVCGLIWIPRLCSSLTLSQRWTINADEVCKSGLFRKHMSPKFTLPPRKWC